MQISVVASGSSFHHECFRPRCLVFPFLPSITDSRCALVDAIVVIVAHDHQPQRAMDRSRSIVNRDPSCKG